MAYIVSVAQGEWTNRLILVVKGIDRHIGTMVWVSVVTLSKRNGDALTRVVGALLGACYGCE